MAAVYLGLQADSWVKFGTAFGVASFLSCRLSWHFIQARLIRKGYMTLEAGKQEQFWKNRTIRQRCAILLAILLIVTGSAQICFNEIYRPLRIARGKTFDDYVSFHRYMLQDVEYNPGNTNSEPQTPIPGEGEVIRREIWVYHDNPKEGEMVCRYVQRNMSVMTVRTSDTSDGLPVTAITFANYRAAERKIALINGCFVALYIAESLVVLLIYRKKRVA